MVSLTKALTAAFLAVAIANGTAATEIFTDDFESGAAPEWGNERGAWEVAGGVYYATLPSNSPPVLTSLPFTLRDFAIDVDINDIEDGGVWLRIDIDEATGTTRNGVVLVTGGFFSTYAGFYWHVVENGVYSPALALSSDGLFESGVSDVTIHVRVTGNTYEVFLDDAPDPVSTLVTDLFCEGRVGLYDFSAQTFDNFVVTEIESTSGPDFDGNGFVDFQDLLQVLANWGPCPGCCQDLDGNGAVDFADLLQVLSNWGAV